MRKLFSLFLALVATTSLWAHDFEVDGIYYNYLEDNNVEVTYRGDYYDSYDEYAGEVIIPSTVTFDGTTYIVTSIGNDAFSKCLSLTSITIPNSVTSIGEWAFFDCSSLTSITIPNSVTSIGAYAFWYCSSLTSVTIPNSVTSIGIGAFYNCSSLTSITIPNSVTSIGDEAFWYCENLTSVTIGEGVTSIGFDAFSGCSSLTTVICTAVEVPNLEMSIFDCVPLSEATLYVPAQSLKDYKAADQWKEFGTILPLKEASTAVDNIPSSANPAQKLLRNGQVYILKDDKTYTIMGAQIQ